MSQITPELLERIRQANKRNKVEKTTEENLKKAEESGPYDLASPLTDPPSEEAPAEEETIAEEAEDVFADHVEEIPDEHGNIMQRIPFKNGVIEGNMEIFDETGNLIQLIPYKNNTPHGISQTFDALGHVTHEVPFVSGVKEGKGTFYANQIKVSQTTFKADAMNGPCIFYHPNGRVSTKLAYKNNQIDGELIAYDESGDLIKKSTYEAGNLHGVSETYYPEGKIYESITYENNLPTGDSKTFFENGNPMTISHYEDHKLVYMEIFNEDGTLKEKQEIKPVEIEEE